MVKNTLEPTAYNKVKFCGDVADLFDRFIENRITSDFAVNEILKEAEDAFFERVDDENPPIGLWRGEFWGKLIISASRVAKYKNSEKIKQIIKNSTAKIISSADADGYIGSYKNPEMVLPCPRDKGIELKRWECDWCWNIWCRKYTLWGLLEAYELLEDKNILSAAENFTNQLIDMLDILNIHICETGTFKGVASASILKPILILYKFTQNQKYLDFALKIADGLENETTKCAKIIKQALRTIPPHLWNIIDSADPTEPNAIISHKAYETMSCFDGIIELYRVTGDAKYLTASENFWDCLVRFELNPAMSVGFNDIFLFAAAQQSLVSEPCDVIHFIRITSELFKITGDKKYMDMLELSFENAMLASIDRDGKWGARGLRGNSHSIPAESQCDLKHNHCCVNNVPRGMLNVAEMIITTKTDDIYVNLYTPSEISLDNAKISISEGYIQNQTVTVNIQCEKKQKIFFRIPSWSNFAIINGEKTINNTEYFCASAKAGKNEFTLEFDNSLRVIEPNCGTHAYSSTYITPLSDYMLARLLSKKDINKEIIPTTDNKARLMIGPLVLAKSKIFGSCSKELFEAESIYKKDFILSAKPTKFNEVRAAFKITYSDNGTNKAFYVGDYAWVNNFSNKEEMFSIYM